MMKSLLAMIALCATLSLAQRSGSDCCELSATLEKPAGTDTVLLRVTTTNTSDGTVSVFCSSPERDLRVEIVASSGRRPDLTSYGKVALTGERRGSRILREIRKGATMAEVVDLRKLFSLTSGDYSILISRDVLVGSSRATLQTRIALDIP